MRAPRNGARVPVSLQPLRFQKLSGVRGGPPFQAGGKQAASRRVGWARRNVSGASAWRAPEPGQWVALCETLKPAPSGAPSSLLAPVGPLDRSKRSRVRWGPKAGLNRPKGAKVPHAPVGPVRRVASTFDDKKKCQWKVLGHGGPTTGCTLGPFWPFRAVLPTQNPMPGSWATWLELHFQGALVPGAIPPLL